MIKSFDFYFDFISPYSFLAYKKLKLLNKNKFFEDVQNKKIKNELKNLTDIAFENDIFGAPTFVVNKKIFWGQDRLDYALDEYNS